MFYLLAGATTAIVVLIVLPMKWKVLLRKEAKRRTRESEEPYDYMKQYLDTVDTVLAVLQNENMKGKYQK
jgi:hypothetical protein